MDGDVYLLRIVKGSNKDIMIHEVYIKTYSMYSPKVEGK